MNPADFLRGYAEILELYPLTTITSAGAALEKAFLAFLSAVAEAPSDDAFHDAFLVTARAFFALHLAYNGGEVNQAEVSKMMFDFGRAVGREQFEFQNTQSKQGMH